MPHLALVTVQAHVVRREAHSPASVPDHLLVVHLGAGGDLAKDHDHVGLGGGLARHLPASGASASPLRPAAPALQPDPLYVHQAEQKTRGPRSLAEMEGGATLAYGSCSRHASSTASDTCGHGGSAWAS